MRQGWVAVTPISPYAQNALSLDTTAKISSWPVFSMTPASL
jgi:hypothetical protein